MRVLLLAALLLPVAHAQTITVTDLPTSGSAMGRAGGPVTYYSLRENRVVPASDSATTAWDVGFQGTTLVFNGGTSGSGRGAAALLPVAFETLAAVPDTAAFVADGERACPRGVALAVCTGSSNGWYLYAGNGVTPIPGLTLAVRLADGGTARMHVLDYRLADDDGSGERPRFYTFEYAIDADAE